MRTGRSLSDGGFAERMKIGIPAGFVGFPFLLLLDLVTALPPTWGGGDVGTATGIVTSWDDVD